MTTSKPALNPCGQVCITYMVTKMGFELHPSKHLQLMCARCYKENFQRCAGLTNRMYKTSVGSIFLHINFFSLLDWYLAYWYLYYLHTEISLQISWSVPFRSNQNKALGSQKTGFQNIGTNWISKWWHKHKNRHNHKILRSTLKNIVVR